VDVLAYAGPMDRRAVGALLLALALLAAAVVPSLAPERIAGIPVAEAVPGPPVAGQCVLRSVQPRLPGSGFSAAVLSYGSCTGLHYGEVVEVLDFGGSKTGNNWPGNAVGQACTRAVVSYLGLTTVSGSDVLPLDSWSPVFHNGATVGIPDAAQSAAGQHWVACTLIPQATGRTRTGYRGQNRDVLQTGRLADGLGMCGNNPVVEADSSVPCDRPHLYQAVGETVATVGSPVPKLTASCEQLVRTLTGMKDITANGRLRVAVVFATWGSGSAVIVASAPLATFGQQSASCAIRAVGTSRLTGSLLGLGTAAVPLAG